MRQCNVPLGICIATLLACKCSSGAEYAVPFRMSTCTSTRSSKLSMPPQTLLLRGGSNTEGLPSNAPDLPLDPKTWQVEDVLVFLESLRPKFQNRTDVYLKLFQDNDIDGAVLLGLNPEKLEKVGITSLGHREHLVTAVHELRANKGMARGPGVSEFDAAMMAQQAPPKNPPRKISTQAAPSFAEVLKWRPIERMAWDQKGRDVDIYLFLEGVGDVDKDDVKVEIGDVTVDVRVRGLRLPSLKTHNDSSSCSKAFNYVFHMPRLYGSIIPSDSFWRVRADRIHLKLYKATDDAWLQLSWDSKTKSRERKIAAQNRSDPGGSILSVIKDMYEDGDPVTRKAISQAWANASEKAARGDGIVMEDDALAKTY